MAHAWDQHVEPSFGEPAVERDLFDALADLHAERGDGSVVVAAFRAAIVLVPQVGAEGLLTGRKDGLRWIFAFTSEAELGRFAAARGEADRDWPYLTVLGRRLLDVVVPEIEGPAGVALDVAGARPMLFPPVKGIVPAECAVA